jgi:hypothetical protein
MDSVQEGVEIRALRCERFLLPLRRLALRVFGRSIGSTPHRLKHSQNVGITNRGV